AGCAGSSSGELRQHPPAALTEAVLSALSCELSIFNSVRLFDIYTLPCRGICLHWRLLLLLLLLVRVFLFAILNYIAWRRHTDSDQLTTNAHLRWRWPCLVIAGNCNQHAIITAGPIASDRPRFGCTILTLRML